MPCDRHEAEFLPRTTEMCIGEWDFPNLQTEPANENSEDAFS